MCDARSSLVHTLASELFCNFQTPHTPVPSDAEPLTGRARAGPPGEPNNNERKRQARPRAHRTARRRRTPTGLGSDSGRRPSSPRARAQSVQASRSLALDVQQTAHTHHHTPPSTSTISARCSCDTPSPSAPVTPQAARLSVEGFVLDRVVFEQVVGEVVDWVLGLELANLDETLGQRRDHILHQVVAQRDRANLQ